jgi:hypothetical protein
LDEGNNNKSHAKESPSIRKLLLCLAYKLFNSLKIASCNGSCWNERIKESKNVTKMISVCYLLDFVKWNGHYLSKVDLLSGVGLGGGGV